MEQVTDTIAQFICHTQWEDIPQETIEMSKLHILDTMGVLFAGCREKIAAIVKEYIKSLGCRQECTLITQGIKTSAQYAAFGNGIIAHVLDFDDYEIISKAHPSATVLPAVLALGEKLQASGKECLGAYLLGVEVVSKIGRWISPGHYNKGWHSTATLGTLGAASASSKLLKLDPEKTRMAIGIAASMSSGLRGNFGTMTKALHAGHAAKNGVEAATLASLGFTASKNILEQDLGFCNIFAENNFDLQKMASDLGSSFSIISPGFGKKPYPSCASTHSFLDGILHLINKFDIKVEDVDSVECGIPYLYQKILIHSNPQTGLEGKFSLEFCVALALQERTVNISQFADSKVNEPKIRELIKRIRRVIIEKDGGKGTQSPGAVVTVHMKDGKSYSHKAEERKGSPANPLARHEIINKFIDCAELNYTKDRIDQILKVVMNIEKVYDIGELIKLTIKKWPLKE
jgi:2-methylcitrate dehydratase PrpD